MYRCEDRTSSSGRQGGRFRRRLRSYTTLYASAKLDTHHWIAIMHPTVFRRRCHTMLGGTAAIGGDACVTHLHHLGQALGGAADGEADAGACASFRRGPPSCLKAGLSRSCKSQMVSDNGFIGSFKVPPGFRGCPWLSTVSDFVALLLARMVMRLPKLRDCPLKPGGGASRPQS